MEGTDCLSALLLLAIGYLLGSRYSHQIEDTLQKLLKGKDYQAAPEDEENVFPLVNQTAPKEDLRHHQKEIDRLMQTIEDYQAKLKKQEAEIALLKSKAQAQPINTPIHPPPEDDDDVDKEINDLLEDNNVNQEIDDDDLNKQIEMAIN